MFKHKCEMYGLEFETNNTRAKYCTYCRDKVQAYADSPGMSMNKLPLTALEEYQKNHGGNANE